MKYLTLRNMHMLLSRLGHGPIVPVYKTLGLLVSHNLEESDSRMAHAHPST
jgi:hypothetical protein